MARRKAGEFDLTEEEMNTIEQKAKEGKLSKPRSHHAANPNAPKKGTRPDVTERNLARLQNQAPKELNSAYIDHGMGLLRTTRVDLHSYQQVHDRVEWYFRKCAEDGIKPNRPGLELCLHTDVGTIQRMKRREGAYSEDGAITAFITDVLKLMETYTFVAMQDGSINALVAFFTLKNHYGYTDKTEVIVKASDPLGELPDSRAVAERINADVVDIIDVEA